ncbi:hypothetical protein [Solimonas flava]|uniref:hypothetical protein n=1 Tax=Solimonas flava TaxID=415849 RepID=UPI00048649FE|nr:hypothetical protein [Solimonas flava]
MQQLLRDLSIGDLQYREFAKPQAARLRLAPNRSAEPPAAASTSADPAAADAAPAAPAAEPAAPAAVAAPLLPDTATRPAPARSPAATPRAVHESPLNFTFERLRRQAIPSRATPLQLDLKLPSRTRATLPSRLDQLQKRSLAEVFGSLCRATSPQRNIS